MGAELELEYDNQTEKIEMEPKDISRIASYFNGRIESGEAKAAVTYSLYDFDAPDDDPSKETVFALETATVSLGYDKVTGFYQLDVDFPDCDSEELKVFWGRLQKHRICIDSYPEKTWIFFIQLIAAADEDSAYIASIINPLAYFLTQKVPGQVSWRSDVGDNVYYCGNTVRMLIAPQCVEFEKVPLEDDDAEFYDDNETDEIYSED